MADFTGRTGELARVCAGLTPRGDGTTVPVVVVSGPPGAGKTTLALQAAHALRAQFPDGQLWAAMDGGSPRPHDPGEVLGEWLRALGVPGTAVPENTSERSAMFRSRLAGRHLLVLVDDAASVQQVMPLLPGTGGSAVLVTSRRQLPEVAGALLVPLGPLPAEEAHELLRRITGADRVAAEPQAAAELITACASLPLAVRIAGAKLAARPSQPLRTLAEALRQDQRQLGAPADVQIPDQPRLQLLHAGTLSVRASIASGYQALSPAAQRAFCLLGLLGPCDVAEWVIAALLTEPVHAVTDELTDRSMLTVVGADETGQARYRLHDLLRDYAAEQARLIPREERCEARLRALNGWRQLAALAASGLPRHLVHPRHHDLPSPDVVPSELAARLTAQPLAWFRAERENLLAIVENSAARGMHTFAADLATYQLGAQMREHRHADATRAWQAVAAAAAAAGDAVVLARACMPLAEGMSLTGAVAEAIGMLRECVAAFERHHRDDDLVYALRWVALMEWQMQHYEAARSAAARGAGLARRIGDQYAELLNLSELGLALVNLGDHDAGIAACERAAAMAERLGEQDLWLGTMLTLALACLMASQYERALHECERCRDAASAAGDAVGLALGWGMAGDACYDLRRYEEAAAAYRRALPVFQDQSVPRHHALCLYKLGCAHHSLGRHDEAVRYLEASLPLFRNLDPPAFAQQAERALHACRHPTAGPRHLPIHARAVGGQPLPGAPLAGCGGVTRAG